jgi:hypothetical protein
VSFTPAEQAPTLPGVGAPPEPTSLLHTYDGGISLDVASELAMTANALNETASASIHSSEDMIRSAVTLRMRLRSLAAAVNAERGEHL